MNERQLTQRALVSMWLLCGGGCTLSGLDDLSGGATETNVFRRDGGMDGGEADGGDGDEADGGVADAGNDTGATDAGSDGGSDAGCPAPPTDHKRAFVTSKAYFNPLNGVGAADLLCQRIAEVQCLGGRWLAWLSQVNSSPGTHFEHATLPYRRLDGMKIADNWTDLTDGSLDSALSIDETGQELFGGSGSVWTGTTTGGNTFQSLHCNNWTSNASDLFAKTGNMNSAGMDWTHQVDKSCAASHHLYCFEQ